MLGGYWKLYQSYACFNGYDHKDLCLDYCPACCDGEENDGDGYVNLTDYDCTCGLDSSEEQPMPPIPEILTLALVCVGIAIAYGLRK